MGGGAREALEKFLFRSILLFKIGNLWGLSGPDRAERPPSCTLLRVSAGAKYRRFGFVS